MSMLRRVYLALAIVGAVYPFVFAFRYGQQSGGPGLDTYLTLWPLAAPDPNSIVAAMAFFFWVTAEVYVRKNWLALVALPVTFLIGLGCGLPLYLFLRTAPVR